MESLSEDVAFELGCEERQEAEMLKEPYSLCRKRRCWENGEVRGAGFQSVREKAELRLETERERQPWQGARGLFREW